MRLFALLLVLIPASLANSADDIIRIGMIGLDTSHCLHFTKLIHNSKEKDLKGLQVVAVYPQGSPDIQSSVSRVPEYTIKMKDMGVKIIEDLPSLIAQVDVVLLETNDGRPHLEQIIPVLKAGKPCFVDKPIAGSLADCLAIFSLANHYDVPVFSSSSLRYGTTTQAARNGSLGEITGCSTWSPCGLEKTHPDLYWYGIHGVESLFTVMGPGVKTVTRSQTPDHELVTGIWNDGRIGTFRGLRAGKRSYGGTAFGSKANGSVGNYDGYAPLLLEIAKFFRTREVPIAPEETIDIYAFMEAADESKRQNFAPVSVADVIVTATLEADAKVTALLTSP